MVLQGKPSHEVTQKLLHGLREACPAPLTRLTEDYLCPQYSHSPLTYFVMSAQGPKPVPLLEGTL